MKETSNIIDIKNYLKIKKKETLKYIEITIRNIFNNKQVSTIKAITKYNTFYVPKISPEQLLSVDFAHNYNLLYKKMPKYLDISKALYLFKSTKENSILQVDAFPYTQKAKYIDQSKISFAKHSIVFGSSGCGKSKFLSLLIKNIQEQASPTQKYKIVIIDPHAALENDIGALAKTIDFKDAEGTLNLFENKTKDTITSVELLLDIFKGLLADTYNSKLERVLRHSLYLLLENKNFNFKTLRKLLLDLEYRTNLLKKNEENIPFSVLEFFYSEFNELKVKSYTEAISPIIAIIDEMEMIPAFNKELSEKTLHETIEENFLTLFSLDRTSLGDRGTKTIAGLVMQQLLTLVQNHSFNEHIIFIIDEVAVVENPIINRFLAEARKYNLSLILAGQYFNGISKSLAQAIFANVVNYYIFRVSKDDATTLVENFTMKILPSDTKEEKVKLLTDLQDRECIIRISSNNKLLPALKCKTLDFKPLPRIITKKEEKTQITQPKNKPSISFETANINLHDLLITNSTSRKVVRK